MVTSAVAKGTTINVAFQKSGNFDLCKINQEIKKINIKNNMRIIPGIII